MARPLLVATQWRFTFGDNDRSHCRLAAFDCLRRPPTHDGATTAAVLLVVAELYASSLAYLYTFVDVYGIVFWKRVSPGGLDARKRGRSLPKTLRAGCVACRLGLFLRLEEAYWQQAPSATLSA